MLPLNLSDTAATSQDGPSLEFIAAIAGRQCYIQDASGRGLCLPVSSLGSGPRFGPGPEEKRKLYNRTVDFCPMLSKSSVFVRTSRDKEIPLNVSSSHM